MTCRFCEEPETESVGVGRFRVEVCAPHAQIARDGARGIAFAGARAAGVAFQRRAPGVFLVGRALFAVAKAAQGELGAVAELVEEPARTPAEHRRRKPRVKVEVTR